MNEVRQGQSFLDMVLQGTGSIDNTIEMAVANNLSITSDLPIGQRLIITEVSQPTIVNFYRPFHKRPATAWNTSGSMPKQEGISFWAINIDFIVS